MSEFKNETTTTYYDEGLISRIEQDKINRKKVNRVLIVAYIEAFIMLVGIIALFAFAI